MTDIQYILRVIDFETTGIPEAETPHSVVEAAYVDIDAKSKAQQNHWCSLVIPETPMDIRSLAVHHITEAQAQEHGMRWPVVEQIMQESNVNTQLIYVAHNAEFEKQFFSPANALWIDTYKVALKLYPDAPAHNNQVMKYFLGIEDHANHHPPHRALPDCYVTAEVLVKMSEQCTFNDMIKISKQPPYYTKLTFGKHKGEKYEDVPHDYLQWLLRQDDMEEGVKPAAERVLQQ